MSVDSVGELLGLIRSPSDAVLAAVAYADVFDAPVNEREARRYAIRLSITPARAAEALSELISDGRAAKHDGWFCLPGREAVIALQAARRRRAVRGWAHAQRYARWLGRLPWVRMAALTGALANDRFDAGGDVDFLIVTKDGRLWTTRAASLALGRGARLAGPALCPNFLISERALALQDRNLFAAQELARMVPLLGVETYARLREANAWVEEYLPNAAGPPRLEAVGRSRPAQMGTRVGRAGRATFGEAFERWEMARKVRMLRAQANGSGEAEFGPDICKGHFAGHARRTLEAFAARLERTL
jgi:hypothetical protein